MRPYKSAPPADSIARCKVALGGLSLFPQEVWSANPYPGIYSCTLELPTRYGRFRANGKGRTREYCLASAYAELVERICHGLYLNVSRTWHQELQREFGFYVDPRESLCWLSDLLCLCPEILDDLVPVPKSDRPAFLRQYFEQLAGAGIPGIVSVPYHHYGSDCPVDLPHSWMQQATGSNGMAAGNTYHEAVYQALCELMERWAAAMVFFDRLTPPDVPRDYLQAHDEYELIREIEASGKYTVAVKDFSSGLRLPALGVILSDRKRDTYRLNVGCDTSFPVALSRCLTEVLQGLASAAVLDSVMLPIPRGYDPVPTTDIERNLEAMRFARHMRDATGVYPSELFFEGHSYEFRPLNWGPAESFDAECDRLVFIFALHGHQVYVRDVSFLGFPVVHVYVPGITSVGRGSITPTKRGLTFDAIEWAKCEHAMLNGGPGARELDALSTLPLAASVTDLCSVSLKGRSKHGKITVGDYLFGDRGALPRCPDCEACELRPDCLTMGQINLAINLYPVMREGVS